MVFWGGGVFGYLGLYPVFLCFWVFCRALRGWLFVRFLVWVLYSRVWPVVLCFINGGFSECARWCLCVDVVLIGLGLLIGFHCRP